MREFDLILFGVTGYTGKLVAEALLASPEPGLKWAVAGRNLEKLKGVVADIARRFPEAASLALVVADVADAAQMADLAKRTSVVCTTVGPYAKLGDAMVAACVAEGTDYCDLTGEVSWMRQNIDAYHSVAAQKKCRIVHAAGFDSIPFDIGVYAVQKHSFDKYGKPSTVITTATRALKGGFSGGTVASMGVLFDAIAEDRTLLRLMANPYALVPGGTGPDKNDSKCVEYWPEHGVWTAPFIMAGCNTRVVRRTHALLGMPWGEDFSYAEASGTGPGVSGWMRAHLLRLALGTLVLSLAVPMVRGVLVGWLLPAPGEGPSERQRREGRFSARVVGECGDERVVVDVSCEGDPGYLATSRMLAQTAVALAKDELPEMYGVLTPGALMGDVLLKRLPKVGVHFKLRS
jgi:short subunit dehydrogenase-like uncharacterized protein